MGNTSAYVTEELAGYAIFVTPEARSRRDTLDSRLRLKLVEITEMLALDPKGCPARTQKLPVGNDVYLYEHQDPAVQITFQLIENSNLKVIKFVHFAALKIEVKRTLFISYSHQDEEWLTELKKFLKGLEEQDVALWDDKLIDAGSRWREEIAKALAVARAALLLVSQDFLNSDFITREELLELLKKAEKEGLKIFWVPLRPSTVASFFTGAPVAVVSPIDN